MATTTVNIHEAKTNLSKLIARVEGGEDIVIARAGKPAVRLVQMEAPTHAKRRLGFLKGQFKVPNDIKTPFLDEIEKLFYSNPYKLKQGKRKR